MSHVTLLSDTSSLVKKLTREALKSDNLQCDGWKYLGAGISKSGFRKHYLVAKEAHDPWEIQQEVEFYLAMRSTPIGKHLARIYGYSKHRIVQEFVGIPKSVRLSNRHNISTKFLLQWYYTLEKMSEFYDFADAYVHSREIHNVGFKNKRIMFFDFAEEEPPRHASDYMTLQDSDALDKMSNYFDNRG